jgi:phenylalanyl-tRNA synthetase beta chain
MKVSLNWIKEYTSLHLTPEELKRKLSVSLTEVEDVEQFGKKYEGIISAEVTDISKHPESQRLLVLKLDVGDNISKQVVVQKCPVKIGDKVPYLKPGLVIPETAGLGSKEVEVKEAELGGIKSDGMVPSGREMMLNNDHTTVYTLPEDSEIGVVVNEVLGLTDYILEIKNKALTHRPDAFSVVGIAREVHAIQKQSEFKPPNWLVTPDEIKPDNFVDKYKVSVENEIEALCNRYMAVVIDNVEVKPSPKWMQIRLSKMGIRPVNNIVDISNYLMLEAGQPNHAFDYDKVVNRDPEVEDEALIKVRLANSGESITTLDGQKKDLFDDTIVIADSKSPIGIAGVMGGKDTEISDETKTVIFQVENLDMYSIRRTSMKVGLFTDAVTRFSKGLDPNLCEPVFYKGIQMMEEIGGGQAASKLVDVYPNPVKSHYITLNPSDIRNRTGNEEIAKDLTDPKIVEILERLGLEVKQEESKGKNDSKYMSVKIPTFRKDLNIWQDLLEEVERIYGYDKVKPSLPLRSAKPVQVNESRNKRFDIKTALKSMGANEIYTYSFVGRELYDALDLSLDNCHKLKNPLSPKLEYMRPILTPSLLTKLPQNLDLRPEIAVFEIEMVNPMKKWQEDDNASATSKLPYEPWHLALAHTVSFYHAKHYLEDLATILNINDLRIIPYNQINKDKVPDWIKYIANAAHPSRLGFIEIGSDIVGLIGQVDSDSADKLDLPVKTSFFEIRVDDVESSIKSLPDYKEPSKFPSVVQDFCFELDGDVPYSALISAIKSLKDSGELIRNIECVDIYQSEEKTDIKKVTVRATFQSDKKTLEEDEIENLRSRIINKVEDKTGGKLAKKRS